MESHDIYEIMWTNKIETDRPQLTLYQYERPLHVGYLT